MLDRYILPASPRAAEERTSSASERLSAESGAQQLELSETRDELGRAQDELSRLRDELSRARDAAAAGEAQHAERARGLEAECVELRRAGERMQTEGGAQRLELSRLHDELTRLRGELSRAQEAAAAGEAAAEAARASREELLSELSLSNEGLWEGAEVMRHDGSRPVSELAQKLSRCFVRTIK